MTNPDSATPTDLPDTTQRKLSAIFTRDEMRMLNERSDVMGAMAVAFTWTTIVSVAIGLVWGASQPLHIAVPMFVVGFVVLGGRHLALAILSHEAAHKSLFKTTWLNEFVGEWLCARPVWNDMKKYRAHHFVHHRKTMQTGDTDLSLVTGFPTPRNSLTRKFARDIVGLTGLKLLFGRTLMDLGLIEWTVANDVVWLSREGRRFWSYPLTFVENAGGMLLTNALLFGACAGSGHAWLYAIWVLSYVTPFPLFLRIRSIAEHACTETTTDMFLNTRTTHAGLLARATVAPHHVNFHIEHHAMPGVSYFRLPRMHRMLRERGVLGRSPTYADVLEIVTVDVE